MGLKLKGIVIFLSRTRRIHIHAFINIYCLVVTTCIVSTLRKFLLKRNQEQIGSIQQVKQQCTKTQSPKFGVGINESCGAKWQDMYKMVKLKVNFQWGKGDDVRKGRVLQLEKEGYFTNCKAEEEEEERIIHIYDTQRRKGKKGLFRIITRAPMPYAFFHLLMLPFLSLSTPHHMIRIFSFPIPTFWSRG